MMRVAVLEMTLSLPGVGSLKEKRGVVKSLVERARQRFQVAAAEVDHLDYWQSAGLGFAAVGNDAAVLQSRLSKVADMVAGDGRAVLLDYRIEVIS